MVIPLWKGKRDRWDCSNYCGITWLSMPGKVFSDIHLKRIRDHLLRHQRSEQSGFTSGKSTIDYILALWVTVERRSEFGRGMLATEASETGTVWIHSWQAHNRPYISTLINCGTPE
ncbi:uncharacterized protein LOC119574877 [Penaeus monodon]|uniref:uncharacterized protein LOC119574877 n=1 Tax=Penaeus monodon TaxID=6687 RepID=UPI0018A72337|nr:uncharacterized protein LOC119574877 [Penaeus monodon]